MEFDDFLAQSGVKGMHWGVRKEDPTSAGKIRRGLTKANVALDAGHKVIKEGEKQLIFLPKEYRQKAASATQSQVLGVAMGLNKDPRFKGKDIKHNEPLKAEYHKLVEQAAVSIYKEQLSKARTKATLDIIDSFMNPDYSSVSMRAPRNRVRHDDAQDFETLLTLHFKKDGLGHIVGVTTDLSVEHGDVVFEGEEVLEHSGVKGMKWGVRKEDKISSYRDTAARNRRIADGSATRKDKVDQAVLGKGMHGFGGLLSLNKKTAAKLAVKYDKGADRLQAKVDKKAAKEKAVQAHKDWKKEAGGTEMANKVYQKAAKDFEKTAEIINNDPNYKGKDVTKGLVGRQYQATMSHYFNEHMAQASVDLTLNDQGRAYIYQFDVGSGLMRGVEHQMVVHAENGVPDYKVELDDLGHMVGFDVVPMEVKHDDFEDLDDFLAHYGVAGMKWGVRKEADSIGVSHKTAAAAKKDAEEFTRAKLFYGEGAGTRRKLIKAKVEQRSKNSPDYKKAFDHFTARTDLAKRSDQARGERRRKDISNSTRKTVRGVKNVLVGNPQHATVAAIGLATAGAEIHKRGIDKQVLNTGKQVVNGLLKNMKHDGLDDILDELEDLDLSTFSNTTLDEIAHSGVKGMKWGVRKDDSSGVKHPVSDDHARAAAAMNKARTHGISSLSTAEMRDMTQRLEVERKFHQLSAERARAARPLGRKIIDAMLGDLSNVAKQEGQNYSRKLLKDLSDKPVNQEKPNNKKVGNLDDLMKPYSNRR